MKRKVVKEKTVMQIVLRTGAIFFLLTLVSFIVIYFVTKKEFESRTEKELMSVTEIVKQSITSTQEFSKTLENLADLRLYTISEILAEELKGKGIEDVTQEELIRLSDQWGLSEISLFVQNGDDIVVAQSSDPKELGLSAKDWGYWYDAMQELFAGKPVTVTKGYTTNHYWVGPLSLSEVEEVHYKYAYYYDGTTDFMLNPYMNANDVYALIRTKGTTELIEKIRSGYDNIDEIAVINVPAYLKGKDNEVIEPMTDTQILYGVHETKLDTDATIFKESLENEIFKRTEFTRDGRTMQKIYISLPEQRLLTVVVNTDEQQRLMKHMFIIFAIVFAITISGMFLFSRAATGKALKRLAVERERLMVAEDFKRTIELLPSAIYKCKVDNGRYILTYGEGSLIDELGIIDELKGKPVEHIVPSWLYTDLYDALQTAYRDGSAEFTHEYKEHTYHHVLKAICDIDNPDYVVEIAAYAADITERMKANEEIRYLAMHDVLTKLPNRAYFHEMLEKALRQREQEKVAVIFIDLDNFKQVNDSLGHEAGDLLLVEVAERLQQCVPSDGLLSRMGGDEFTVLLPQCHGKQDIENACRDLQQQLKQPFYIMDQELFVTASIGASFAPDDGGTGQSLLKNADIAMYGSKQNGKNSYQFYTVDLDAYNVRRIEIQHDLRQSMEHGQHLFLVYQPQYSLETDEVVGVEALLRWQHPEKGFISPAEFIPIAEESGLIEMLGDWILREACAQYAAWIREGLAPIRMSVNLSARQFKNEQLAEKICDILDETKMPPQYLNLEITESTSMEDITHTIQVIQQLRNISIGISIDDFGTGYSSLNYLKDFSISHLKIDQSFIRELRLESAGKAIVKSIIDLAVNLDVKVIAEGVETKEEFDMLRHMGCHEIQGYYFSKPVSPECMKDILERSKLLA